MKGRPVEAERISTTSVSPVADDWMLDRLQVDPDLVRAPRFEATPEQRNRRFVPSRQNLVLGTCWFPVFSHDHARRVSHRPTDRRVDEPRIGLGVPPTNRQVTTRYGTFSQLIRQRRVGERGSGEHENTRCPLVEAMHDTGAIAFSDIGYLRVPGQYTLRNRARGVPGTRVHDLTRSLVDDNDVLINMDNVNVDA